MHRDGLLKSLLITDSREPSKQLNAALADLPRRELNAIKGRTSIGHCSSQSSQSVKRGSRLIKL